MAVQLLFTMHGPVEPACLETLEFSCLCIPESQVLGSAADGVFPDWASSICLGMLASGSVEGCYHASLMMTTSADLAQSLQEM